MEKMQDGNKVRSKALMANLSEICSSIIVTRYNSATIDQKWETFKKEHKRIIDDEEVKVIYTAENLRHMYQLSNKNLTVTQLFILQYIDDLI